MEEVTSFVLKIRGILRSVLRSLVLGHSSLCPDGWRSQSISIGNLSIAGDSAGENKCSPSLPSTSLNLLSFALSELFLAPRLSSAWPQASLFLSHLRPYLFSQSSSPALPVLDQVGHCFPKPSGRLAKHSDTRVPCEKAIECEEWEPPAGPWNARIVVLGRRWKSPVSLTCPPHPSASMLRNSLLQPHLRLSLEDGAEFTEMG